MQCPAAMSFARTLIALFAATLLVVESQSADASAHYSTNDLVDLWANKIGPYNSPTESYGFFEKLAWCRPSAMERRSLKLGEALAGDFLVKSPYRLPFRVPQNNVELCEAALSAEDIDGFIVGIKRRFVYDLLLDDLPMKLFVGELSDDDTGPRVYLYTNIEFTIHINGGNIIEASATPGQPVPLHPGRSAKLRFSYAVKWQEVRSVCSVFVPSLSPTYCQYTHRVFVLGLTNSTPSCHARLTSRTRDVPKSTKIHTTSATEKYIGSASETLHSAFSFSWASWGPF